MFISLSLRVILQLHPVVLSVINSFINSCANPARRPPAEPFHYFWFTEGRLGGDLTETAPLPNAIMVIF